MHSVPVLPVGRFRAVFTCETPPRFSDFPANAWRGALGYALKRSVCVTRQRECKECMLYRSCLFPYFWDTPPHAGTEKMRKYEAAPHPFVLDCDDAEPLRLGFTLFGLANRHLPVFIHALTQAAAGSHGVSGNVLRLLQVEQAGGLDDDDWRVIYQPDQPLAALPAQMPAIPDVPATCELQIQTPLRVKREGRIAGVRDFAFADLFGNLLRRVSMLTYFHTDTGLDTDFRALSEAARAVTAKCALTWREQTRYSNRQKSEMQLGGVVGRMSLENTDLAPFWPYLWLGQFTHAGKNATMGLGRYRVLPAEAASLPGPLPQAN